MSKEEIVLQLTLKSIERMSVHTSGDSFERNKDFSNQVVDFYNNIYQNLKLDNTNNV